MKLKTRTNKSGYRKFIDPATGKAEYTHRRVAEKKMGGKIYKGCEVHHVNGNKTDNRPSNLRTVSKKEHRDLHKK